MCRGQPHRPEGTGSPRIGVGAAASAHPSRPQSEGLSVLWVGEAVGWINNNSKFGGFLALVGDRKCLWGAVSDEWVQWVVPAGV